MSLSALQTLCLAGSLLAVNACSNPPETPDLEVSALALNTVQYTASNANFRNPERGFYADSEYYQATPSPLTAAGLTALLSNKSATGYQVSLVHRTYFLPEFINTPALPASFLNTVQGDLQAARAAGVKLILRFAYRTVALEDCQSLPVAERPACEAKAKRETDPQKQTILNHLENLRGVFASNTDVIAYLDAGFLGTYGEWAYATPRGAGSLLSGADGTVANANTQEIIAKFLDVLPSTRAIAIRNPAQRVTLLQGYPDASVPAPGLADAYDPLNWNPAQTTITDATAFQDSDLARLGAHNDCFLASPDDFGTYYYGDAVNVPAQIKKEKEYLSANNLYVPMGGETCAVNADVPAAQFPAYARTELRKMRWSTLNTDYNADVLSAMGGVLLEAKSQLGYKLVLVSSSLPATAARNEGVSLTFKLRNDGYAPPFNPRGLEVVFSKVGAAPIRRAVTIRRSTNTDPRFWKPATLNANGSSTPVTYTVTATVPAPAGAGTYSVSLNLPDPLLPSDARYSLRLSNTGLWYASKLSQKDSAAAFNALNQTIQIP